MNTGAVKSSRALLAAYGEAIEDLERRHPTQASIVRQYVPELHEEAGQWRRRYRDLQLENANAERRAA